MADTLTITKTEDRVLILHLAGRLDSQTRSLLLDEARQALESGVHFLLIDLQGLEMITSAGLGTLHNIYKLFTPVEEIKAWEQEKHGEPYKSSYFKLAGAPANIYYILNIAGFLNNIPIYPSTEQALESFAT